MKPDAKRMLVAFVLGGLLGNTIGWYTGKAEASKVMLEEVRKCYAQKP